MSRRTTATGVMAGRNGSRCTLAALAMLAAGAAAAADMAPLKVCLLSHNAPYSTRDDERGFDLDTAKALAARLARPLELVWTDNNPHIDEIDDSDFPLRKLAKGACDVILSMPGPAGDTLRDSPKLALGDNYYGAAFELLSCDAGAPKRLRALRGKSVAIQSQTVAHFAALSVKATPSNYFSLDDALAGLRKHETEAALLWGPTTGWRLHNDKDKTCGFVAGYEPPAAVRWNLSFATRKADEALRGQIDTALAALTKGGELRDIAARYGVPIHAPFDETYSLRALNDLQQGR
ncbi:MAG: transporter substrate-binding domain-containing protein [Proteobacteria bacterium]|nr:transporter substrate-binding domain-containing protein [Pseudomonadota bacterium]